MDDLQIPENAPKVITIPYTPRSHFRRLHESTARWIFVVAHRRAGKTVALVNQLIRAALRNKRKDPPPRYAYIGPSFAQTKDLAWGYLKRYSENIPGMKFSESELSAVFPNGARISLYGGAEAYERMRGLYFDGAVMDEYAMLNPDAWDSVVRPCLADYRGFAIMSGTANGDDHFKAKKMEALSNLQENGGNWDYFDLKVTETDALHPDEVAEMRQSMSENKFNREMMNSFEEPVEGAYYGELLQQAEAQNRICGVPHDPRVPVFTWWDLGMRDLMAIWFLQYVGRELRAIDYMQQSGKGLPWYAQHFKEGHRSSYNYMSHVMPSDVNVRELGTGRSRLEVARELGFDVTIAPKMEPKDGIEAVRGVIPICYFDQIRCNLGLSALRSYQVGKNGKPLHNWASHGADAYRHGSVSLDYVLGWSGSNIVKFARGPLKRNLKGVY